MLRGHDGDDAVSVMGVMGGGCCGRGGGREGGRRSDTSGAWGLRTFEADATPLAPPRMNRRRRPSHNRGARVRADNNALPSTRLRVAHESPPRPLSVTTRFSPSGSGRRRATQRCLPTRSRRVTLTRKSTCRSTRVPPACYAPHTGVLFADIRRTWISASGPAMRGGAQQRVSRPILRDVGSVLSNEPRARTQ